VRIGWGVGAGPIRVGGTIWRSKKRRRKGAVHKVLPCGHAHRTQQAYDNCPRRKMLAEQAAAQQVINQSRPLVMQPTVRDLIREWRRRRKSKEIENE
jgi:hypothetical protein